MLRIVCTFLLVAAVANADRTCNDIKRRLGRVAMQCAEECREEIGGRPEDVPRLVYLAEVGWNLEGFAWIIPIFCKRLWFDSCWCNSGVSLLSEDWYTISN